MLPDNENSEKNNDELLNDLRQKLANQSNAEYEEKRNDLNVSKNVFIGALSGIALAGIVGWFVLSPQYASDVPEELPVIRRPQEPIKVQPRNPGGMEIQNQDKSVYNIIDQKENAPMASTETILPPPEEPKLPTIVADMSQPQEAPQKTQENLASSTQTIAAAQKILETPTPKIEKLEGAKIVAINTPQKTEKKEPHKIEKAETQQEKKVATKTKPAKVIAKTGNKNIAVPTTKQPQNIIGQWQVQLMASSNKQAIISSWPKLAKKYTVLQNHQHNIETADLGKKGIFYRLQVGAFAQRQDADTLCHEIKALGGSCIVKKK